MVAAVSGGAHGKVMMLGRPCPPRLHRLSLC